MSVFKIEKNKGYTVMSNYHLRDKSLSYKAKGLLSFMLSLPDDWDYSLNGLVSISKESRDGIRTILKELQEHHYLEIEKVRGEKGYFEYNYLIYEIPQFIDLDNERNNPDMLTPHLDNPNVETNPQINTNIINTNNKIDKDDKTNLNNFEEFKHNYLTEELIKNKYITCDDSQVFYYDSLFEKLLGDGNEFQDLLKIVHYIVPRVVRRDFKDEDGNEIENKFGYFKNSIISNINRFHLDLDELWGDEDMELYDDYFEI